ncbi:MAG TPA: DUF2017 family protein [Opitutus sp.]|nr:DUF2017 family protein [Opitutus sp.]
MKRIEVKLSLTVVAPLLDVIKGVSPGLRETLAAPLAMEDLDAEFRAAWTTDLRDAQTADVRVLLALFDENFFSEGVIGLDETNAEPVVRACAAVRLRLRDLYLKDLGDEILESSEIEIEELEEPVRKAFMCYLFLATLQELIIQHLDSEILES